MGFDCSYQGIPASEGLIARALKDPVFAEEVFYSVVAFATNLERAYYCEFIEFAPVKDLFKRYAQIGGWNYTPNSRMHDALIYTMNPDSFEQAKGYSELEKTFYFRFVKGECRFSEHMTATQGIPVRISSPEFIAQCVDFCQKFSVHDLALNFDAERMAAQRVYKVGRHCDYESVENYFVNLAAFYKAMAALGSMSVFVVED